MHFISTLQSTHSFPSGTFPLGFPSKTCCTFCICPFRVTWLTHLIILDFIGSKQHSKWKFKVAVHLLKAKQEYTAIKMEEGKL
jgi:hypothetical protein